MRTGSFEVVARWTAVARWIACTLCLALLLMSRVATAACDGCVVVEPAGPAGDDRALIVLLHGDEGHPRKLLALWRPMTTAHDVVLFAPRCPADAGCRGSWWRWNEDPTWLVSQASEVADRTGVDPARRFAVGWSGGATYLGMNDAAWFPFFAAVALIGGGAPGAGDCFPHASATCGSVFHMMGAFNPHFGLAEATRDRFRSCGHQVAWELLPQAGHGGEWRAFVARRDEVFAWLQAHPDRCDAVAPKPASSARAMLPAAQDSSSSPPPRLRATPSAMASNGATPPASRPPVSRPPASSPPASSPAHCGCRVLGAPPAASHVLSWLAVAAILFARRRTCSSLETRGVRDMTLR